MIIVTGSHGFIGSNLIRQLNKQGIKEILAVDYEPSEEKFSNLIHCEISDFMDAKDFYSKLREGYLNKKKVSTIFHQGACSDTMEWDAHYILKNNYGVIISSRLFEPIRQYVSDNADQTPERAMVHKLSLIHI